MEEQAKRRNLEESSLNFAAEGSFLCEPFPLVPPRGSDNVASKLVAGFFVLLLACSCRLVEHTLSFIFFLALCATEQPSWLLKH